MRNKKLIALVCLLLTCILSVSGVCETRDPEDIILEMIIDYGYYQDEADASIEILLDELESADAAQGRTWRQIMRYWRDINHEPIRYDALPEGLDTTDAFCLVVLGFQLKSDGGIRPELEARLQTALACAQQYPNAFVLCTGGGTASKNPDATEAGVMAHWLAKRGVSEDRLIVENASHSTSENAMFSYRILREKYPQVRNIAIISTDYHIAWGSALFEAEFLMGAMEHNETPVHVAAHAACRFDDHEKRAFSEQAKAMLVLTGLKKKAEALYRKHPGAPKLRG